MVDSEVDDYTTEEAESRTNAIYDTNSLLSVITPVGRKPLNNLPLIEQDR